MSSSIRFLTELGPLLIFFIAYKYSGLFAATCVIIAATLFTQMITYYFERKISPIQIFTNSLLVIFGGLTIYSGDSTFIKLKPTIINLLFAGILLCGVMLKKGLLKFVFNNSIQMQEKNWIIFSRRWGIFFLFLAGLNEIVWRNSAEHVWVNFKVFGIMGLTIVFLLSQMSFLNKNMIR